MQKSRIYTCIRGNYTLNVYVLTEFKLKNNRFYRFLLIDFISMSLINKI